MLKISFDRNFWRPLPVTVSSPLVFDVSTLCGLWDGPCFNLSSTSFSFVNRKTYIVHQTRKLLNTFEAKITNYSLREKAVVFSPPHKRSDTRTPSDDQWHNLHWEQHQWWTDLRGTNVVKIWNQHGTILINSSFEHNYYHHQTPAPKTPGSDLDCGQPQGHHSGAPQLTVPGSW